MTKRPERKDHDEPAPGTTGANVITQILMGLLGTGVDYEISGSSQSTGLPYLLTVKPIKLFAAVFTGLSLRELRTQLNSNGLVRPGGIAYQVAPSFQQPLLALVRKAQRAPRTSLTVASITIQDTLGVRCFIGQDHVELQEAVSAWLPEDLALDIHSLRELERDRGRKVGFAAKDKARLHGQRLTLEQLAKLEQEGEAFAQDAVQKSNVISPLSCEQLRERGVAPNIAFLMLRCHRVLRRQPYPTRHCRAIYVEYIPKFFAALGACRNVSEIQVNPQIQVILQCLADVNIVGKPFLSIFETDQRQQRHIRRRIARVMDELEQRGASEAWKSLLQQSQPQPRGPRVVSRPLPTRVARKLSELQRIGPAAPSTELTILIERFGFTGVEIGKWIHPSEIDPLLRWVVESCHDLEDLLGTWLPTVIRRGNLALALGARGHGRACACYEPGLRVINLTRFRGDGSLAHEFAHFLDDLFTQQCPDTPGRHLCDRVLTIGKTMSDELPIAQAMRSIFQAIGMLPTERLLVGNPAAEHVDSQRRILHAWKQAGEVPQAAFGQLMKRSPRRARTTTHAQRLADSLAKWTETEVVVRTHVQKETRFLTDARLLGKYWKAPHELFARAFETWCEDELQRRGRLSEYLVSGTQRDFSQYVGSPYPQSDERLAINESIGAFVKACAAATS